MLAMNTGILIIYFSLALVSTFLPGPSATLVLSHGAVRGVLKTWPTVIGVNTAVLIMMLLSYTGLGSLAVWLSNVFYFYCVISTLVLLSISWNMWQSGDDMSLSQNIATDNGWMKNNAKMFTRGFLVSASNPKALGFFFLIFPSFVAANPSVIQFIILALIWVGCETFALFVYAASGARLMSWFSNRGGLKLMNRICAVFMVFMAIGVWILPESSVKLLP
jgi:threonine/homoserine/homoserine lactone efflux protein